MKCIKIYLLLLTFTLQILQFYLLFPNTGEKDTFSVNSEKYSYGKSRFWAIKNKDINNIYLTQKVFSPIKCSKYNLLTGLKKQKTEKTRNTQENRRFCMTSTGPLRRFCKREYKSFLNVMGIYLQQNHFEKVHWKTLL